MKRNLFLALTGCLLVAVCFSGCHQSGYQAQTTTKVIPEKKLVGAKRFERQGWVYVHLEGAPDRIGYQHGALLAKEIEDLLRVMKPMMTHSGKHDWIFFRDAAEKMLWPK